MTLLGDLHMILDSKNHQMFVIDSKQITWKMVPAGAKGSSLAYSEASEQRVC